MDYKCIYRKSAHSYKYIIMHANLHIQKLTTNVSKSVIKHAMHTLSLTHTHIHTDTPPLLYPSSFRQRSTHTPTPLKTPILLPHHLPLPPSTSHPPSAPLLFYWRTETRGKSKGRVWRMYCFCVL